MAVNMQKYLNISAYTAKGSRDINEDAYWHGSNKYGQTLCIICDGIGSQDDSQLASQITVNQFKTFFLKHKKILNCKRMFHTCLIKSYKLISFISNKKLNGKRTGTTVTALFIDNNCCTCLNLGDSRLYHYSLQMNKWDQITIDHNLYNQILETIEKDKSINKEELFERYRNQLHALTRCLESNADVHKKYDIFTFEFNTGDVCFLASDGVYHFIRQQDINNTINTCRSSFDKVSEILVQKALQNKSNDNLTCIVVEKTNVDE